MKRIFLLLVVSATILTAQQKIGLAVHAGVGTDINLGLGIGGRVSMTPFTYRNHPLELGAEFFYSNTVEVTDEGFHEYEETTTLMVFGILGNVLFNYREKQQGLFYIVGVGLAGVSVEWTETSETDSSLGTPYGDSGSQQSSEGTAGGSIVNIGLGYNLGNDMDLRLEVPVLIIYSAPGEASAFAPSITLMAGYRF